MMASHTRNATADRPRLAERIRYWVVGWVVEWVFAQVGVLIIENNE